MTHTFEKYGDIGNFSGVTYVILSFLNLKFVGTWAPTAKIFGDIPDFNVLNVPKMQPGHNPAHKNLMGKKRTALVGKGVRSSGYQSHSINIALQSI